MDELAGGREVGWESQRMRPFIDDLHLLVDEIDFGAAVDVIVLADNSVQLVIGEPATDPWPGTENVEKLARHRRGAHPDATR